MDEDDHPTVEQQEEKIQEEEQQKKQQQEEQEETGRSYIKALSRYVKKNNYKDLIISVKSEGIQTRKRKIESSYEHIHLSVLSKIELNCFEESRTD